MLGPVRTFRIPLVSRWLPLPFLLLASFPPGQEATAQAVRGHLLDQDTQAPIPFATVELLVGEDGGKVRARVLSDSTGLFLLVTSDSGRFRLRAERIGYQGVTSPPFDLVSPDTLDVELNASVDAVPLAPLVVLSNRTPLVGTSALALGGFYERNRIYGDLGLGIGRFVEMDDWEGRVFHRVSDLFRGMPGVSVWGGSRSRIYMKRITGFDPRGCQPTVYVNGQLIRFEDGDSIDDLVSPSSVKALEVYHGMAKPAEFMDMSSDACGAIVIWTG